VTFRCIKDTDMATTFDTPHSAVFRTLVVDDCEPWRQQVCSILQTQQELRVVAGIADGAGRELLPAVAGVLGGDDFVSSGIKGPDSGRNRGVNGAPIPYENTQFPVAT